MDLLMEYIVKEKYVDPYMMPAQFVGAVWSHILPHLQKFLSTTQPVSLQQTGCTVALP
jgi:hypothetical protein